MMIIKSDRTKDEYEEMERLKYLQLRLDRKLSRAIRRGSSWEEQDNIEREMDEIQKQIDELNF